MINMARIQGPSMGFANFERPILQTPRSLSLPIVAGSYGGGADGGDAPAPAPLPEDLSMGQGVVQTTQTPPTTQAIPAAISAAVPGTPTWATVGLALVAGIIIAKIL